MKRGERWGHERWRHTLAPATVAVHRRGVPVLPFRSHLFDRQFFGGIRPQKVVSAVGSRLKEIRRGLLPVPVTNF